MTASKFSRGDRVIVAGYPATVAEYDADYPDMTVKFDGDTGRTTVLVVNVSRIEPASEVQK